MVITISPLSSIPDSLSSLNFYFFLTLFIIFSWTLFILKQLVASDNSLNPPTVFHWIPFVGSAIAYGNDPLNFLIQCRKKYGDIFTIVFCGKRITVTLGPHGSEFIFNGSPDVFNAEDVYTNITTPIVGKGVAYDVPSHVFGEQKKFLKFGLSSANFRHYVGLIEDEVEMYMDKRLPSVDTSGLNDVSHWPSFDPLRVLEDIAILTSSRTLQGREVRSNIDGSIAALYKDLDAAVILINFVYPDLPLPVNKRRDKAQQAMSQFYIDIIQKRRLQNASKEDTDSDVDLITSLLGQTYKNGRALEDYEIAHLMIGLLMASQHTSAASGSWILLHLAANPNVAEAVYAEQQANFSSPDGSMRPMTYDELRELPLLNAIIRETLRIHPPIHSILRHLRKEVIVPQVVSPNMYSIPAGHYVLTSPLVAQMDSETWTEPEKWHPFRWIDSVAKRVEEKTSDSEAEEEHDIVPSSGFKAHSNRVFQPFGTGKHKCIGEQFAYVQLGTIVATIVRRFKLRTESGTVPAPNYKTMIITPKDPRRIYYCKR